ncbi:antichymotrypsin-2-like, partial [Musca vetustissima]|uniref:antichymotrypsin-2-like n=1 Tax=Musca vetustissima TaxID=27455 RepID=UPI002AB7B070
MRSHSKSSNVSDNFVNVNAIKQDIRKSEFLNSLDVFGDKLFQELVAENPGKSIFFSPFSIQTCLTMTRMGTVGQISQEMDTCLNITGKSLDSVAHKYHELLQKYENNSLLKVANKIYVMENHNVKEDYNKTLVQSFFATVENIDFSKSDDAASAINKWVEHSTD